MRLTPVDILANWYNDETLPWSAQKAVNCLAETAEVGGTRSVAKTKGLPGRTLLADLGTGAPIRGAEDVEGRLMVVSGNSLFEIHPGNTFTNRGTIPGVGLVSISHNKQGGTTAANEVAIANGLSGYVYNTETTALVQITDDAFPGATTFDYCDGYTTFTDPEGRFWGHSALNQATQYSSIDRYDAESAPDKIVSHIVSHREVMVFGTRTTEFFRNTGAATGTFQRVDGTEMEVGIAAPLARARMDNTVYWLGSDGLVYRLAGHSPQRVSTRPIEQAISRFNLANAFAHTWEDRGHQVFYLTFPDGLTFGYDVATSLWHARETYGLDRWGVNTTTYWNRMWVTGDYSNGKLHRLNWDDFTEDGRPLVMECQPGVTHADGNEVKCPYVELFMDTGQSPNPQDLDALEIEGDAPDSIVNRPYNFAYSATGGFGIYTFSTAGPLPGGVTLSPSGVLSGVTAATGVFSFTVTVTDSLGNMASTPDTVTVAFSASLIGNDASNVYIWSGLSSQYTLSQTLPTSPSTNKTCIASDDAGTYNAVGSVATPFIRLYKQSGVAYTEVPSPVDVTPGGQVDCIAFTPDAEYMAVFTGIVLILYKKNTGLDTYTLQNTTNIFNQVRGMKFSADGQYIAVTSFNGIRVFQRSGSTLTQIFSDATGFCDHAFNGNLLVATRSTSSMGVFAYSITGSTVTLITGSAFNCPENGFCQWSNEGSILYVGGNVPSPRIRALQWTGTGFTQIGSDNLLATPVFNMSLDPTGRVMCVTSSDANDIRLYEVDGATLTLITPTTPDSSGATPAAFVATNQFRVQT